MATNPRKSAVLADRGIWGGLRGIEQANREHGIEARPGSFAENLTILRQAQDTAQGLDLLSLKVGDRLRVGEALLEVVQIGKPPEVAHTYHFQGVSALPTEGCLCRNSGASAGWWRAGGCAVAMRSPAWLALFQEVAEMVSFIATPVSEAVDLDKEKDG